MTAPAKKTSEYGTKGPRKLNAGDLKRAEVARPDYRLVIKESAITIEDILRPEYWANVGGMFAKDWPFSIIEVVWEDGSKYLRLIVMECGALYANVKILEVVMLAEQNTKELVSYIRSMSGSGASLINVDAPPGEGDEAGDAGDPGKKAEGKETKSVDNSDKPDFWVEYKGPSAKWSVIRKSDGERIDDGHADRASAQKWLDEYQKALQK